ncbi:MAG: N-succinylglutamate 5-semialdehyde dehydrogenase [Sandaracinus sp.]|nr:N-succinylglutamate 5-semialdehyde dehydrogenase [Sandaracinus sp.]
MTLDTFDAPGDYINGAFVVPDAPDETLRILSPADQNDVVGVHPVAHDHVDQAIDAARRAYPAWRRLGEAKRRELLRKYQEVVRGYEAQIAETIAREVGKPLWDAMGEAKALAGKVDLMLGEGARFTRDEALDDLPGAIRHRPHGVLSVVGPFNFPAHLPNGQIVPALLHGNTVVFKPSEKTPNAAVWLARAFHEAGFPPGVFNVVQGGSHSAKALVRHRGIDGILFTGSVAVGQSIVAANADRPGCLIALELGGKNASIVLDDADVERAARQIAFAAYASAGQRCTATSRVYATPGIIDRLQERLAAAAQAITVGYPLDSGVFMGPLIDEGSRERLLAAQGRARAAGFEAIVDGGALPKVGDHQGWYVRPSLHRAPRADLVVEGYTHDELFGPDVALYPVADLAEACQRANGTRYGLAAAVFTASEESFEAAADELRVGVLHWNQSSAGASGRLPFGGVGESGNHRPAGILAGTFCAWPQAVRFTPPADAPLPTWPGLYG